MIYIWSGEVQMKAGCLNINLHLYIFLIIPNNICQKFLVVIHVIIYFIWKLIPNFWKAEDHILLLTVLNSN